MVRNVEYQRSPFEERYDVVRELGSGHFAVVRQCVEKTTGLAYAAKFIRKRRQKFSRRGAPVEDIDNEIALLFCLKHEHIISLHEVYEDDHHVILVLELVSGGELFHYLSERDHLSEEDASKFVQQILRGLDHLHQNNIAHLDLKPENILLSSSDSHVIKIIDFGLAKRLDPGGKEIKCMMGTAEFVAPEVVNYEALSLQSDMWSVGVITYMLLSGSSPFVGQDQQETFANITRAEFDFDEDVFTSTSDLAKDFIRKLLVRDPKKRATARQAMEHPWIRPRNSQQAVKRKASAINMTRLKAFAAKRRWHKSLRVIKLCNRLSRGNRPASTASYISTDASSSEGLDVPENFVTRAIFCAVEDGNRQGLERLLGMATVDLGSASETGVTAAHVAAGAGRLPLLQYLHVNYRLNICAADQYGDTPLHWAARQGRKDVIKYLLDSGVDASIPNIHSETALLQAVRYGHRSVFQDLLASMDETAVNSVNTDGEGCIHTAAWYGSTECIAALLGCSMLNGNLQNFQRETALHICAVKGNVAAVESLVMGKADVNLQDQQGWVPLVTAIRSLHLDIVDILLPKTKLNVVDKEGLTILHHAAETGNLKVVEWIVESVPEFVKKVTERGKTALHLAARYGHLEVVRLLCANGVDVEALDADGLSGEVLAMLHGMKPASDDGPRFLGEQEVGGMSVASSEENDMSSDPWVGEFLRNLGDAASRAKLLTDLRTRQGYLNRFSIRILGHSRVGKTSLIKSLQNSSMGNFVRRGSALFRRKTGRKIPSKSPSVSGINQMRYGYPLFQASSLTLANDFSVAIFEVSADPLCVQMYNHLLSYTGSLYVVVYSLTDPASVQRQQVSFWLRLLTLSFSVEEPIGYCGRSANVPTVLLVGTHADTVKCNKSPGGVLQHPAAFTLLETMKRHFGYELTLLSTVFIVENGGKNPGNVTALKNCMLSMGKQLRVNQNPCTSLLIKVADRLPTWRAARLLLEFAKWTEMLQNEINPLITFKESSVLTEQLLFMGEIVNVRRMDGKLYVVVSPHFLFNHLVMPFLYGQLQLSHQRAVFRPRDLHFVFWNYWPETTEVTEALLTLGVCSQSGSGDSIALEFPAFVERSGTPLYVRDPGLTVNVRIPDLPSYPLLVFPKILAHVKSSPQLSRHLSEIQVFFRGARIGEDFVIRWNSEDTIQLIACGDKSKNASLLNDLCTAVDDALHLLIPSVLLEYTIYLDGRPVPFLQYDEFKIGDLPLSLVCRLCHLLDPKNSRGQDWCLLAVKLELYDDMLSKFAALNASVPTESTTHRLLKEWNTHAFPRPTVQDLIRGLEQIERGDVVMVLKRFLPVYKLALGGSFDVSPSSPFGKTLSSMSSSLLSR